VFASGRDIEASVRNATKPTHVQREIDAGTRA
jgi:hypothetical protein